MVDPEKDETFAYESCSVYDGSNFYAVDVADTPEATNKIMFFNKGVEQTDTGTAKPAEENSGEEDDKPTVDPKGEPKECSLMDNRNCVPLGGICDSKAAITAHQSCRTG